MNYENPIDNGQKFSRFSAMQGNGEERTEPYAEYGVGAPEPLTQQSAKSIGRAPDSVWGQDNAARGISVHDGFPNPAADTSLQLLDLNQLLIRHRVSTYFMRVAGWDWQDIGIFNNDILIIDRALKPRHNDIVVWWEGESFRLSYKHQVPLDTPTFGVVASSVHQFRRYSNEQ